MINGDVWFRFQAPVRDQYHFTACFPLTVERVAVYDASECLELSPDTILACSNDACFEGAVALLDEGQLVLVQVGADDASSRAHLEVRRVPPVNEIIRVRRGRDSPHGRRLQERPGLDRQCDRRRYLR